jgi:hypothetical protein
MVKNRMTKEQTMNRLSSAFTRMIQVTFALLPTVLAPSSARAQMNVPLFGQAQPLWANHHLGTSSTDTIGRYGCGDTSIAMVYRFYGITTDPDETNTYLTNHGAFSSGDLLNWGKTVNRGVVTSASEYDYTKGAANLQFIYSELDGGHPVIAEVRYPGYGRHYVVLTGRSGSMIYCNDPVGQGYRRKFNDFYGDPSRAIYFVHCYRGRVQGYTSWGNGMLVKEQNSPTIAVIEGGALLPIPTWEAFTAMYTMSQVNIVPDGTLASITLIPRPGTFLQENTFADIYVVGSDGKLWDMTYQAWQNRGGFAPNVVPKGSLGRIPYGGILYK